MGAVSVASSVASTGTGGGSSTTVASSTVESASSGTSVCVAGQTCLPAMWCSYGGCPSRDQPGTCVPAPAACDTDCPGVCGCDGIAYCNECLANAAGVDVDPSSSCSASYYASSLATNVPRFI